MKSFIEVFFSHPLEFVASILLAGAMIQMICTWIEARPRRAGMLAFIVTIVTLTGCSTTTTRYADGREVTTTNFLSRCVRHVVSDAVGGGAIGWILDKKTGARIGAAGGTALGLTECDEDTPRVANGGQQQVTQAIPSCGGHLRTVKTNQGYQCMTRDDAFRVLAVKIFAEDMAVCFRKKGDAQQTVWQTNRRGKALDSGLFRGDLKEVQLENCATGGAIIPW